MADYLFCLIFFIIFSFFKIIRWIIFIHFYLFQFKVCGALNRVGFVRLSAPEIDVFQLQLQYFAAVLGDRAHVCLDLLYSMVIFMIGLFGLFELY